MNANRQADQSFEALLEQLDAIVTSLEADDLSLEEAIERYERAVELAAQCTRVLDEAELRVRRIDGLLDALTVRNVSDERDDL